LVERKIFVSPLFGRQAKKLKKSAKLALDGAVLEIFNNPSIGEAKLGDLAGVSVYKFTINKQRILLSYTYTETEIHLLTFGGHENFYRDLSKYRKS